MKPYIQAFLHRNSGYSLIELLIVLAITSILLTLVFGFFQNQRYVYLWENQKLERDQNARTVLDLISQELKSAGFCAADRTFVESLECWVPSRFVPSFPLDVTLDTNPKVTLGDNGAPDMLTFACVMPTECNPTTSLERAKGTELMLALNKSETNKQYRIGDVIQVGCLPEYAVVRAVSGNTLSVDTDPVESGWQPFNREHPAGSFVGELYIVSYAVFNENNDPKFERHTAGCPVFKRKVNAGGFQPVAEHISDMRIDAFEQGSIRVTLTATTERPNFRNANMNGALEITQEVFIRNTKEVQAATTCLKPAAPKHFFLYAGLDEDYPCRISMGWEEVSVNEGGEALEKLGCPVTGYRVFFDVAADTYGYYIDTDTEAKDGFILDAAGIPAAGFFISVAARNSGGLGHRSREIPIFDTIAPRAPKEFMAKVTGLDRVTLTWQDNPECDVAGYYVYRKTAMEGFKPIHGHLISQGKQIYEDLGLESGKTYGYVMEAVDFAFNAGERSDMVSITLPE